MSDFLLSFRPEDASILLPLLRKPYEDSLSVPRTGFSRSFPWGALAILRDGLSVAVNYSEVAGLSVGWVGDLVWARGLESFTDSIAQLERLASPCDSLESLERCFRESFPFDHLNGAGSIVLASKEWVAVVVDPMAAVQAYKGVHSRSAMPGVAAVGTHPDLVARLVSDRLEFDPVSVAEFINEGTSCKPHTIHKHVRELAPGRVHLFWLARGDCQHSSFAWWSAPRELSGRLDQRELQREFADAWQAAVVSRCAGSRLGVQLSGGLDSRLVLAAIPEAADCVALTLTEGPNRETRIARRVAQAYNRSWRPLDRGPEYLAETALASIRFTGCEGEWHHAHSIGFAEEFAALGLQAVFTGLYMDNNFKGYYAKDLKRVTRLRGLLPATFAVQRRDYIDRIGLFCREHLVPDLIPAMIERRRAFYGSHFAPGRTSEWEWLDGYPVTQASDNTGWIVERRLMPLHVPVMDRALVDLALKIPATIKAGGEFFRAAAALVLGVGNRIPNANDGARPDCGHLRRLVQRGGRIVSARSFQLAARLGARRRVQHSWHDYREYWRSSPALEHLRASCRPHLAEFENSVFKSFPSGEPWTLDRNWRVSYRILQLAIWRKTVSEFWKGASLVAG